MQHEAEITEMQYYTSLEQENILCLEQCEV